MNSSFVQVIIIFIVVLKLLLNIQKFFFHCHKFISYFGVSEKYNILLLFIILFLFAKQYVKFIDGFIYFIKIIILFQQISTLVKFNQSQIFFILQTHLIENILIIFKFIFIWNKFNLKIFILSDTWLQIINIISLLFNLLFLLFKFKVNILFFHLFYLFFQ